MGVFWLYPDAYGSFTATHPRLSPPRVALAVIAKCGESFKYGVLAPLPGLRRLDIPYYAIYVMIYTVYCIMVLYTVLGIQYSTLYPTTHHTPYTITPPTHSTQPYYYHPPPRKWWSDLVRCGKPPSGEAGSLHAGVRPRDNGYGHVHVHTCLVVPSRYFVRGTGMYVR